MSKFQAVFTAKQKAQEDSSVESPPVAIDRLAPPRRLPQSASTTKNLTRARKVETDTEGNREQPVLSSDATDVSETRRPGRPNAKRSDPDFVQTTAYIRKATHKDVKLALLQSDQDRDFSELVEELLTEWIRNNGYSKV